MSFQKIYLPLLYILNLPVYWLSWLMPKDKNLWIFGAWGGQSYADNSRYLFEYVSRCQPSVIPVWLSRSEQVLRMLRDSGHRAFHPFSIKGIWYSMRAGAGIITNDMVDINRFACGRMKIVQLWHGIPLKQVLYCDQKRHIVDGYRKKRILSVFFPFLRKNIEFKKALITGTSAETARLFGRMFNTSLVSITGFPRNDGMFANYSFPPRLKRLKETQKLGIYMPTYRQKEETDIVALLLKDLEDINERMQKRNTTLFLKFHPFQLRRNTVDLNRSHICVLTEKEDIYTLLPAFDFLITDYSSIFFDYLLLNRPMIFAPFDYEEYVKKHGSFVFDYLLNTPGPKAADWKEVMDHIEILTEGKDEEKISREALLERIHLYKDGRSSERVYREIRNAIS